jgi:hypothetical protein
MLRLLPEQEPMVTMPNCADLRKSVKWCGTEAISRAQIAHPGVRYCSLGALLDGEETVDLFGVDWLVIDLARQMEGSYKYNLRERSL